MRHRHSRLSRLASGALALGLALPLAALLPQSPASAAGSSTDPGTTSSDASPSQSASGSDSGSESAPSTTPGAENPDLQPFYNQDLAWGSCEDGSEGYECATLTVPLDYDQPDGQTITLALKRLPASDGDAEGGSLFLNPGGPGGSGVDLVPAASTFFTPETLATYDVIGFDPRGVGSSTPLTCWSQEELEAELDQQAGARIDTSTDTPETTPQTAPEDATAASEQASSAADYVAYGQADAAACEQYSQVPELLDHMDATTVVQDMDVMRGVVGDQKLNFLGFSYGTYLGAIYAERFPDTVGRVVLDSAMDPSIGRAQIRSDNIAHDEYALNTYVESCLAEEACPLTGPKEEALAQLDTFLTNLDADPLPVDEVDITLNRAVTLSLIQYLSQQRQVLWPSLTKALGQAVNGHDGTLLLSMYRETWIMKNQGSDPLEQAPKTAEELISDKNSEAAFNAVFCSDYPDTGDEAAWEAHAADLKESFPFSYSEDLAYIDAFCHGWGHAEDARDPAPVSASGSDPILVVGVYDDAQTPYPWSVALADQLDSGHLLSVNEALHGSAGSNTCSTQAINTFLTEGTLPEEGEICPADPLPEAEDQAA
ncbi:alpha/beta hydrolase [Actinomyces wuliandei]|uniref:alpha/beta hydrolase n=1 Tax=Actinomyces wuliandei TaxID=2057743 RepID=UPI0011198AFF|nr:alpha/beta hydrolase [Actinomyces wuliandei]